MLNNSDGDAHAKLRTFLRYSWIAVGVAALCVAWVFYSRWEENRALEEKFQQQKAAQERALAEKTVEMLGGNHFKILDFYAVPGTLRRGDSAELCYGVSNSKSVQLEPQSGAVWPSFSRCVEVSPQKTTTYTLTAKDSAGRTKTATLTVTVR